MEASGYVAVAEGTEKKRPIKWLVNMLINNNYFLTLR